MIDSAARATAESLDATRKWGRTGFSGSLIVASLLGCGSRGAPLFAPGSDWTFDGTITTTFAETIEALLVEK